jgi:N-acetylglucosaminyl-diphospho-decaprenol L-rhamnosyltransferase
MSLPEVSIIIVNYRSAAFTRECLASILSGLCGLRLEIVVVDNASEDDCGEMVHAEFPGVIFIPSERNLGFAEANNLGLKFSAGNSVLFLNPDTVVQRGAIERLHAVLWSLPDAGMTGAKLLNSDESVQTTSISKFPSIANQVLGTEYLQRRFPRSRLWGMGPLFAKLHAPVKVGAISGACMMLKRTIAETVRGFTADYFMYAEDIDLCLKVKKAGWSTYYVPDAVVVHHGGKSSEQRPEKNYAGVMMRESMYNFMRAHHGAAYALLYRTAMAIAALLRMGAFAMFLPVALVRRSDERPLRRWQKRWQNWSQILVWSLGSSAWSRARASSAQGPR